MGTAIAKYYPSYNEFYAEERIKANKDLERAASAKPIYTAIRDALETTRDDYPQQMSVKRYSKTFAVDGVLDYNQHWTDFSRLSEAIVQKLHEHGLRDAKLEVPRAYMGEQISWHYSANIGSSEKPDIFHIALTLRVDAWKGNKFRIVKNERVQVYETKSTYTWLDKPTDGIEPEPPKGGLLTEQTIKDMYDNIIRGSSPKWR
jgi:hypothetical protein